MIIKLNSDSPDSTTLIADCLGRVLKGKEVLLISGDLGAGKTLFTKGVAVGLGIEREDVVSPTFTLLNRYHGREVMHHFDLYRLGDQKGNILPELDEVIDDGVVVVEWAQYSDKSYSELPNAVNIQITTPGEDFDVRELVICTALNYIEDAFTSISEMVDCSQSG